MKLNIGAGDTQFNGFVNCDYDANCNPDYVFNLETEDWPFEDNTVEEVIAHHVLEHLGEGYFHVITELYRVCKHGAIINIRVPHHRHDHFVNDPTHKRAITPEGLWLFSKKYNDTCKERNETISNLAYYYNVNFEMLDSVNVPDKRYIPLFQGKPVEEVETYMREHNNVIQEIHMRLIVIKDD